LSYHKLVALDQILNFKTEKEKEKDGDSLQEITNGFI
jgi:hypothetical protein